MQRYLVMTVIGADRPGLVEGLARTIADHGGNWLESRMGRLGGRFAGILRVSVETDAEVRLIQALQGNAPADLQIVVQTEEGTPPAGAVRVVRMEILGQDRPGIISQITAVLARHRVNVEELESECVSAPMSGEPMFQARARLGIPQGCDTGAVRRDLEKIASDLMVDMIFGKADRD
jgi:glycine cleavage system regulatory protein